MLGITLTSLLQAEETKSLKIRAVATVKSSHQPDTATWNFTFIQQAKKLQQAVNQVEEQVSKLLKKLPEYDVRSNDVRSAHYTIKPKYTWQKEKRVFQGYEVSQRLTVRVRDIQFYTKRVALVLAAAVKLGVAQVSDLTFSADNTEQREASLRKQAIDKARDKAEQIAEDLQVQLGKLIDFNVLTKPQPILPRVTVQAAATDISPSLPTGEIRESITVELVFATK